VRRVVERSLIDVPVLSRKEHLRQDHKLYSPDLAPTDYWLFSKLKSVLKGKSFSDIEDVKLSAKKKIETHSCSGF
jgi:hypothetical protein